MAVYSDTDVLAMLEKGAIRIVPFREANLTPNGYDVTVREVHVPRDGSTVGEGTAIVPAMSRFAVATEEVVELGEGLAAQIWLRTTWARRGVLASFGMIDAGFRGTLTFGAFNASHEDLRLPIGDRFAQLAFLPLNTPAAKAYAQRSGHYQDQTGVRLR